MIHPDDDYGALVGKEHMFYGLKAPFEMIREETEAGLRQQVSDSVLDAIKVRDEPKFLTLGRKIDDGSKIVVTHYGVCVRATLHATYSGGTRHEAIDAVLTFMFGNVDRRGAERCRTFFDLHKDAQRQFTDDVFKARFLAFREETRIN